MNDFKILLCVCLGTVLRYGCAYGQSAEKSRKVDSYVESFNRQDEETVVNHIDNASAAKWMRENIPYFECPDKDIEKTYYFRWWVYRKHIKQTPDGFVITEFLPEVPWAGKYNTISCPAGHHFYEGRWLKDTTYLSSYARFWFRKEAEPRRYSFWAADALYGYYLVKGNSKFIQDLLPDLIENYTAWEQSHLDSTGLFWQLDDRDGMEVSIGGSGYRATINSYLYGDAKAIANIAALAGQRQVSETYLQKAKQLKGRLQTKLWDKQASFFKVLPKGDSQPLADVRELHGYVPWYFNLPDKKYALAWKFLTDSLHFQAPYGPTTAEQCHPRFNFTHPHECQWNGPSWPFATTQTLVALANLLNGLAQRYITKKDYFTLFKTYTQSHHIQRSDGNTVSWIDENLDPFTGEWLARKQMYAEGRPDKDRGKDYNHSAYADLLITGVVGLRPGKGNLLKINPLLPDGAWDYFLLSQVPYRGHSLTIRYDKTGTYYKQGKGLVVSSENRVLRRSKKLKPLNIRLPAAG